VSTVAAREARLVSWIAPWIPSASTVLDIGAGSGLLAEALTRTLNVQVTLVDVIDINRTPFLLHRYDGGTLPFEAQTFDVALLAFVLHHSADPQQTLREACRVARRVVILEDTYRSRLEHLAVIWTDWVLNRGHGVAAAWGRLRPDQWAAYVGSERGRVIHTEEFPPKWLGRYRDPIRHLLLVADVRA